MQHQLLERNCLALKSKFENEPRCVKESAQGLQISLEACLYNSKNFALFNYTGSDSTFDLAHEVDNWCAVASIFLDNYINYELLCSTGETDYPLEVYRQWPPRSYSTDWFYFDRSFELLFGCKDALYQARLTKGLINPDTDFDVRVDSTCENIWKQLKKENRVAEGKKCWRNIAVMHLKDLTSHQEELSFRY